MALGKSKIGISTMLTLVFGGLVALSTGTLFYLSLSNALDSTRSALASRLEALILDAEQKSRTFFRPMETSGRWLANEIATGRLKPGTDEQFRSLLAGVAATNPQISAISYQYPDGRGYFFDVRKKELQEVLWRPEWRARLNQTRNDGTRWPPTQGRWVLRPSVLDGKRVGTFLAPARTEQRDLGVIAVRLDLAPLASAFGQNAEFRGHELVRFLLFNDRIVLGHPRLLEMEDARWPAVKDVNDPYLHALAKGSRSPLGIVADIPGVDTFSLETGTGARIFAMKEDTSRQTGGQATIGVHFSPKARDAEYNRLIKIATIGASLLLGSLLLALLLGRRAAVPMQRLANAAQLVQNNRLEEVETLPVGSVKEMAAASSAFNEMVVGLKERHKIRDLFGKYVPHDVASMLLSDENTAKPRNAIATVFFLDIVGFSSISEKMEPADVVATMNAFFSDAVALIEAEGGMIAQFQGDAILAAFNVPLPQENHAAAATRAAVSIISQLSKRQYGGQDLRCRIGINTGPLVAGAIGAEGRLSYTIYGDAVNVAARLEQLNKEFGTEILMTAVTAEQAEGFAFKSIGTVPIRGRDAPVEVLTLSESTSLDFG